MNNVEKRYQVFVSSTFRDLQDERLAAMKALLEIDCIPVGMEHFPAADSTSWDFIKPLIDSSDYYVVIIGGRYGTVAEGDLSYTRMEYEYAVEKGIPALAFAHDAPDNLPRNKTETDADRTRMLDEFKALCGRRLMRGWSNKDNLAQAVMASIASAIKRQPRPGWVRADTLAEGAAEEVVRLSREVHRLQKENEELKKRTDPPLVQDFLVDVLYTQKGAMVESSLKCLCLIYLSICTPFSHCRRIAVRANIT